MRILITGASGMLGTDLCEVLGSVYEVIPTDIVGTAHILDVTNTDDVMNCFANFRPDVVVHSAAYTDVDGCERSPDMAFRINAFGTWNVAAACSQYDARLLYISTDFVFDGEKGEPYTEYDVPRPLNHYGASKLAGEVHVRTLCPHHLIVRTAWLYGEHGKNFPCTILRVAASGKDLRVVADQIGSPTFTADLAIAIRNLISTPLYGLYHLTNRGSCSWFDFARVTLSLAGFHNVTLTPISSEEWPSPTRRPRNSTLRNYALELRGEETMRSWEEAIQDFIARLRATGFLPVGSA